MERRIFLGLIAATLSAKSRAVPKISDKDVMKDGQPATITNYCTKPKQQPNKFCPNYAAKPGECDTCQFYQRDTITKFKNSEHAKCLLLSDPSRPQFVQAKAWCAQYEARS